MAAPQVSVQVGASAPPPQGFAPPPQQGYAPPPYQGFGPPPPQQGYAPPTQQPVTVPPTSAASSQLSLPINLIRPAQSEVYIVP